MAKQEFLEQEYYIEQIKQENEQSFAITGKRRKYYATTFGCPKVYQRGMKKA